MIQDYMHPSDGIFNISVCKVLVLDRITALTPDVSSYNVGSREDHQ